MDIVKININELIPYEYNLRINDKAVDKVAKSIKEFGFINPIVIDKNNVIVAGHTRLKAAQKLKLKEAPCIVVDKLSSEQVKAFRLADNKLAELADWDAEMLERELAGITSINMADFGFAELEELEKESQSYNNETKIPQYEPNGDDVDLQMCLDTSKADELMGRILSADIPEEIKRFLFKAATRHYVFNYKNIAEYYAQAPKDVQELFEESALVIIDYEDAIANGYVELSKTLEEITNAE